MAQSDKNQFDAQGKRHGVWEKKFPGTDQLRYEGFAKMGKKLELLNSIVSLVKKFRV